MTIKKIVKRKLLRLFQKTFKLFLKTQLFLVAQGYKVATQPKDILWLGMLKHDILETLKSVDNKLQSK